MSQPNPPDMGAQENLPTTGATGAKEKASSSPQEALRSDRSHLNPNIQSSEKASSSPQEALRPDRSHANRNAQSSEQAPSSPQEALRSDRSHANRNAQSSEKAPSLPQDALRPGTFAPRYGTLLGLLAACLVCRIGAALWWGDLLWADSVFYLQVVESLEQGNYVLAFDRLGLNLYPVILMGLRQLGIDWTVVGKWWSVGMATLAVLPVYGWVRRQFGDRIALWAGILYAIHPQLVGHSPLIIRDPTYWFLFNGMLYLTWRAITEQRLTLFILSGVALGLAAYTRTEGWLLIIPLVGWAFWWGVRCRQARWQLALGTVLALAVVPAGVVAVNLTWLKDHPRWEWGRVPLFLQMWKWAGNQWDHLLSAEALGVQTPPRSVPGEAVPDPQTGKAVPGPQKQTSSQAANRPPIATSGPPSSSPNASRTDPKSPHTLSPPSPPLPRQAPRDKKKADSKETASESLPTKHVSEWIHVRRVALRLIKALTYSFGLLIGIGLVRGWRVLLRGDQIVLSLHNLLLFLATCAYQSISGDIDKRYLFPIVMTALPYGALGWEAMVEGLTRVGTRGRAVSPSRLRRVRAIWTYVILLVVALLSLPDLQPNATHLMRWQTAVGQWILQHQGEGTTIMGTESTRYLLGYHAQGSVRIWRSTFPTEKIAARKIFLSWSPDVVILWDDPLYPDGSWRNLVADLCKEFNYTVVPTEELPEPARHVQMWVRPRQSAPSQKSSAGEKGVRNQS